MPSKHDDRRKVEAGPALSGVVERKDADKLGASERLDLIGVGAAGKVQIVRVTQAMYHDIPTGGSNLWLHSYLDTMQDLGLGAIVTIGQILIPQNLVLDISSLVFRVLAGAAAPVLVADYLYFPRKFFNIAVNGVSPVDVADDWPAAGTSITGSAALNQRWNTWFGEVPFHIIAQPSQVVTLTYTDWAVVGMLPATYVRAEVAGRWIPKMLFDEIVAKNRIS